MAMITTKVNVNVNVRITGHRSLVKVRAFSLAKLR